MWKDMEVMMITVALLTVHLGTISLVLKLQAFIIYTSL